MRHRSGIVGAAACAALLAAGPAAGKEVRYPAAHPTVSMNVPDDWSVAETPLGLELQSPDKDALVLAAAVASDKTSVDDWSRRALARMRQAGVTFATTGPAAPAGGVARGDTGAAGATVSVGGRPYTFDRLPSVKSLVGGVDGTMPSIGPQAGAQDLPTISTIDPRAATTSALRALGHYLFEGGKLHGQPVDVELAAFPFDKQVHLLVEQESGPTDARGVMIMRSIKMVRTSDK